MTLVWKVLSDSLVSATRSVESTISVNVCWPGYIQARLSNLSQSVNTPELSDRSLALIHLSKTAPSSRTST